MVKLRRKKLNANKQSLYLDIYDNGTRRYEFLKLYLTSERTQNKEILRLAEGIRAKREIEIRSNTFGFIPDHKKHINFVDYMYEIRKTKNKSNRNMFKNTINYVEQFCKNIKISNVNEIWLRDFETFLLDWVSNNTALDYMRIVSITLNCAVREKIILVNPFKFFKPSIKREETFKTYLTFEEITTLNSTFCKKPEIKRAFLFACYTGLRISDILNLTWANVKEDHLEIRQIKTNNLQNIPLSETAKNLLYNSSDNIYDIDNSKVFKLPCLPNILSNLNNWVRSAGINKNITTHCARHTFATLSLTHGVDLYTISKLLGHSDIKVTQVYAKIVDSKKVDAVNMLPKLNIG